jgi:hypothetical protein
MEYYMQLLLLSFIPVYIVKKLNEKFHCDCCLSPILSPSTPGHLLRLISELNVTPEAARLVAALNSELLPQNRKNVT